MQIDTHRVNSGAQRGLERFLLFQRQGGQGVKGTSDQVQSLPFSQPLGRGRQAGKSLQEDVFASSPETLCRLSLEVYLLK